MTIGKKKRASYPSLHGCYVASEFERTLKVKQGEIRLYSHKGHICVSTTAHGDSAWLRGHDFDRLIAALRGVKEVWLREYRTTKKILERERARRKKR